jgi:hypothetical protein
MKHCININHIDVKELAEALNIKLPIAAAKIALWQEVNGLDKWPSANDILNSAEINYALKAVDILMSDKAEEIWAKAKRHNWPLSRTLTELQIPREQKELILASGKVNPKEIVIDLLSNYSYTIEINTAKENKAKNVNSGYFLDDDTTFQDPFTEEYTGNSDEYYIRDYNGNIIEVFNNKKEAEKRIEQLNESPTNEPTQYYSDLTVPGGTNYTENEIATPAIVPSIKGHAQFSTNNGIGWFRSDDRVIKSMLDVRSTKTEKSIGIKGRLDLETGELEENQITETKTRRILEVQSDLFQKGRDKTILTKYGNIYTSKEEIQQGYKKGLLTKEERDDLLKNLSNKISSNKFLQLLNKDNNWVTFFVKSIIQDSAKKGYEKVLFPTGNTASKVEGHETLQEFKNRKEYRIQALEQNIKTNKEQLSKTPDLTILNEEGKRAVLDGTTNKNLEKGIERWENEIKQLKEELERVETEGFAALKPIYKFYEETVTNILKKQGYNPTVITDEYGNTWNEIVITDNAKNTILFNKENNEQVNENNTEILNRLFDGKQAINADKILQNLIRDNHPLAPLAKRLLETHGKTLKYRKLFLEDKALKFYNANVGSESTAAGYYDHNLRTIFIYDKLRNKPEYVIVHEIMHALSYDALRRNDKAAKEFNDIYLKTVKLYNEKYGENAHFYEYALSNIDEFFVALYSSPNFIKTLSQLKSDKKSIFTEIKEFFKKLLGLDGISMFDEAFDAAEVVLGNTPIIVDNFEIDSNPDRYEKVYSKDTSFALSQSEREMLDNALKAIQGRITHIERLNVEENKAFLSKIKEHMADLESAMLGNRMRSAIRSFFDAFEKDLKQVYDHKNKNAKLLINSYNKGLISKKNITVDDVNKLKIIVAYFDKSLVEIGDYIISSQDPNIEDFRERYSDLVVQMNVIKSKIDEFEVNSTINWLSKVPGFTITNELLKAIQQDVSAWRVWFGAAANASNDLVRALSYKIQEARLNTSKNVNDFKVKIIAAHNKLQAKGFDFNQLYEGGKDGNKEFLISSVDRTAFYKEYDKMNEKLSKIRDFSGTAAEFWELLKSIEDVDKLEELSKKGRAKNVLSKDKDLSSMKKAATKAIFSSFLSNNTREVEDEDGFRERIPNDQYYKDSRKAFNKLMEDPDVKEYYDLLLQQRKSDVRKLPNKHRKKGSTKAWPDSQKAIYRLPQIRKNTLESFSTRDGIKRKIKETLGIEDIEDAYNKESKLTDPNKKTYSFVPVYYTGDVPINERSDNLTVTAIMFTYMANNYANMTSVASNAEVMKHALQELDFKSGVKTQKFATSNAAKTIDNILDIQVYGKEIDPTYLKVGEKNINVSQLLTKVNNWMRHNNLVLKHATALSSAIKASIDSKIETIAGIYTNKDSWLFSEKEFFDNIAQAMSQWGSEVQTNKMHLFFEQIELFKNHKEQYKYLGQSKAKKLFLTSEFWYSMFTVGAYKTTGTLALAIADNYRLYENRFLNYNEWITLGKTKEQWDKLKDNGLTFYQLMTNPSDIDKKVLEQAGKRVILTIRKKAADIDGKLNDSDRAGATQNDLLRLVLTHRAWLIRGIDNRFKVKQHNFETELEEEGYYRTIWGYLTKRFKKEASELQGQMSNFKNMTPLEKQAFLRMGADLAFLAFIIGSYLLLGAIADDEDDYFIDYLAYVNTRVLMEHISLLSPTEFYQTLKTPFPTIDRMLYIIDVGYGIISLDSDELERGPYEGLTRTEKALIELTPGLSIFWAYKDPDLKRQRLEQTYLPRAFQRNQ